jgi:hypothetical protein
MTAFRCLRPGAALAILLLVGAPAAGRAGEAGLQRLARGPVTVVHAPENAGFATAVAGRAAEHYARIREDLGLATRDPVAVLLLTDKVSPGVRAAWREQLPRWLGGVAFGADRFVVVRVEPGRTPRDLDGVLVHELTHVLVRADFPTAGSWPAWFQEALAMREAGDEGVGRFATLALAVLRDRLLPLGSLRRSFPENEAEARLAYAESASFLSFLVDEFGNERFSRLLPALREEEFDPAFARVYGAGVGALEQEWRRRLRRPYTVVPLFTGGGAYWALALLLFFVALARRWLKNRRLRRQWEEEEGPDDDGPLPP